MNNPRKIITVCLLMSMPLIGYNQDMTPGFGYLEKGQLAQATVFFSDILSNHPYNKTAIICYGRAIGLSGKAQEALNLFDELLLTYPGDIEVLLNKAEAHLWLKDPLPAIDTYKTILALDSTSFTAWMGTANSLSMATQYERAYHTIQIALGFDPTNAQAQLSQKFITLAYANQLASEYQKYDEAIAFVMENLERDAMDQESLALIANIYVMSGKLTEAEQTYDKINNPVDQYLGKSIALHLMKKEEEALEMVMKARDLPLDEQQLLRVNTQLVSALLWNKEIIEARETADSLVGCYSYVPDYLASQAEVAMYEADFINGYQNYLQYLKQQPASFKGNLGIADASHALGTDEEAYSYANQTLSFFPGQKDAKNFIQKLDNTHSPKITATFGYGASSDGSSFTSKGLELTTSITPQLSAGMSYTEKTLHSASERNVNQAETYTASVANQINQRLKIEASYVAIRLSLPNAQRPVRSGFNALISRRMSKTQLLGVGLKTEVQDFNSDLLNQNLKTTHLVLKNIMNWKISGLGWYTEAYYSYFSDGNNRSLLFTSFYKGFDKPLPIKTGINYLTMKFDENRPLNYFSPLSYHQFEGFVNVLLKGAELPFSCSVDGAAGYQFMQGMVQFSWRTRVALEKTSGRLKYGLIGAYSSISATQSNGFSFTQVLAKISWQITRKPLFHISTH